MLIPRGNYSFDIRRSGMMSGTASTGKGA